MERGLLPPPLSGPLHNNPLPPGPILKGSGRKFIKLCDLAAGGDP